MTAPRSSSATATLNSSKNNNRSSTTKPENRNAKQEFTTMMQRPNSHRPGHTRTPPATLPPSTHHRPGHTRTPPSQLNRSCPAFKSFQDHNSFSSDSSSSNTQQRFSFSSDRSNDHEPKATRTESEPESSPHESRSDKGKRGNQEIPARLSKPEGEGVSTHAHRTVGQG